MLTEHPMSSRGPHKAAPIGKIATARNLVWQHTHIHDIPRQTSVVGLDGNAVIDGYSEALEGGDHLGGDLETIGILLSSFT